MIPVLERVARSVWAYHYRLRELAYWTLLALAVSTLAVIPAGGEISIAAIFLLVLSVVGIARWKWAKRRYRFSLIVPLFQEGAGAKGRAAEAQALIVDHLRRHLPDPGRSLVQPLPVEVGSAEDVLAGQLQRRLRALFVLHGRIAARGDSWSIYPRVLEPAHDSVTHFDRFTHDKTPSNPRFGPFVSSLQPSIGVRDEEFPLEFCRDLEAVLQGLLGMALVGMRQFQDASEHLDAALEKAAGSLNHQIDALRVSRAQAMAEVGEIDEAITFLRVRQREPDPSAHLLRGLAHLLTMRSWADGPLEEADRDEARTVLRQALQDPTDPQRDMTAYNLITLLPDWEDEGEYGELLRQLLGPKSSYRRLWYVRKMVADRAWLRVEEAQKDEDEESYRSHGGVAARWYSRALRARPRIQYLGITWRWPVLRLKKFPLSPILYANTKDGHQAAGHRVRARYFEWRFRWIRKSMVKQAWRHVDRGEWNLAYANFDWASIVGRHDLVEHISLACAACCCWKGGRKKDGEMMWDEAAQHDPVCLVARAVLFHRLESQGLDPSLPGDEPTDLNEAVALVQERFPEVEPEGADF